jgi:hypothetical protein
VGVGVCYYEKRNITLEQKVDRCYDCQCSYTASNFSNFNIFDGKPITIVVMYLYRI